MMDDKTIAIAESVPGVRSLYIATLARLGQVQDAHQDRQSIGRTQILTDSGRLEIITTPNNGDLLGIVETNYVRMVIVQGINPDAPGPEVIGALRANGYGGIVAIASSDLDMIKQGRDAGADFEITKPFSPAYFLEQVKASLGMDR